MPLSKAHPLRDIHASHSRKLTISVLAIEPKPLLASPSLFPRSPFSFSLLSSSVFLFPFLLFFRSCYVRSRSATLSPRVHEHEVPAGRAQPCTFLADICSVSDPSAAHAIPCQSQGSARLNATSRVRINEEVSVRNVERLLALYDLCGTKNERA